MTTTWKDFEKIAGTRVEEEPNAGNTFALVTGAKPRFDPAYRAGR